MSSQTPNLIHNLKIPGWASIYILDILGKYAAAVPENGTILELGGLFGRSTYTLGMNKKPSVKLITVDIWPTMSHHKFHDGLCGKEEFDLLMSKLHGTPLTIQGEDFYNLWNTFTKDVVNKEGIRNHTNMGNSSLPMVDLIYHDAGHSFNDVFHDLIHWLPKLKKDGIIIVDDYSVKQFPGVVGAVDLFVKEYKFSLEMVTDRNVLLRRRA
jgi:hypothetical protein